ncbi:MAG: Nif3-like dinuclear metal center hexameric protein [Bacteroidales bacterium]|jgi:dinuclear metal center YbgI/SA1388 family protein|nr:Nif3-like dinuclear metal center hexameric protein [Bacteroidales bacterium]
MQLKISELIQCVEAFAPPKYQESYDNSGLLVGDRNQEIEKILVSIDVTEEIVEEAVAAGAGLIIAHHPIVFKGLKRLTPDNYVQRTVISAIKNNVAIYAAHTNMDAVWQGVNMQLAEKLGLQNLSGLQPASGMLRKLYCFVPESHLISFREAVFATGAGEIGAYSDCSFNTAGYGTFRAGENTNPFVGKKGELHTEPEIKVEIVFPEHMQKQLVKAVRKNHPYEEPAYDIIKLENAWEQLGIGLIGEIEQPLSETAMLDLVKNTLGTPALRFTKSDKTKFRKIAVCGGAGAFLINSAKHAGADAFVTGDVKYHEFFDAENRMMIIDAGHYETEQFTKDLFYRVITKNFPNFAVQISNRNTNPVNYY